MVLWDKRQRERKRNEIWIGQNEANKKMFSVRVEELFHPSPLSMCGLSICVYLFSHCQKRLNFSSESFSRQMGVSVRNINMLDSHAIHTYININYIWIHAKRTHTYTATHTIHAARTHSRHHTNSHTHTQAHNVPQSTIHHFIHNMSFCVRVWFACAYFCHRLEPLISLLWERI